MHRIALSLLLFATACGAPTSDTDRARPDISPDQFVLLPCGEATAERPCTLIVAGGKRLLFGAPGSVVPAIAVEDLRQLDALFVYSLRAGDIEGLDDVRNATWRAGRDTPLTVIGPLGIDEVVTAINKAYEQSDALRIVEEGIPPGGYDAAILEARPARSGNKVFDTGDLQVVRQKHGYRITYNRSYVADLLDCRSDIAETGSAPTPAQVTIACAETEAGRAWPLTVPVFVTE